MHDSSITTDLHGFLGTLGSRKTLE